MGLIKVSGCLILVIFSCYMLLLAERGRRYLLEQPAEENAEHDDQSSPNGETKPWFITVGVNVLLLISTFLCYDLVVTNILVFSLSTDRFFLRAPIRVLLCAMVGVLAAAIWFEVPALREDL